MVKCAQTGRLTPRRYFFNGLLTPNTGVSADLVKAGVFDAPEVVRCALENEARLLAGRGSC